MKKLIINLSSGFLLFSGVSLTVACGGHASNDLDYMLTGEKLYTGSSVYSALSITKRRISDDIFKGAYAEAEKNPKKYPVFFRTYPDTTPQTENLLNFWNNMIREDYLTLFFSDSVTYQTNHFTTGNIIHFQLFFAHGDMSANLLNKQVLDLYSQYALDNKQIISALSENTVYYLSYTVTKLPGVNGNLNKIDFSNLDYADLKNKTTPKLNTLFDNNLKSGIKRGKFSTANATKILNNTIMSFYDNDHSTNIHFWDPTLKLILTPANLLADLKNNSVGDQISVDAIIAKNTFGQTNMNNPYTVSFLIKNIK